MHVCLCTPVPVGSLGQDVTTHICSANGLHEWNGFSLPLLMRCVFQSCVRLTRELWTGFVLVMVSCCVLDFAHSCLHLSALDSSPRLVPVAVLHSRFTADLWFDMFLATLWRPGQAFRFPGDPWTNSTSFGQTDSDRVWFVTLSHQFGVQIFDPSLSRR